MPLCRNPIELGHSIVVYCVLREKHDGHCEPEKPPCQTCVALARWWAEHGGAPVAEAVVDRRCPSISPYDGNQCGYPKGHSATHGGGVLRRSWD